MPYGRGVNGVTFHSLRHTAATLLAELDVPAERRQAVMGHTSIETTQQYTHLRPEHERPTVEALSAAMPIADLVTQPRRRAERRGRVVQFGGSTGSGQAQRDNERAPVAAAGRDRRFTTGRSAANRNGDRLPLSCRNRTAAPA